MILVVAALAAEAKPLIKALALKPVPSNEVGGRWQVFSGEHCWLIIAGVGSLNAAAATSCLLTKCVGLSGKHALLVNVGICGSNDPSLAIGTIVYANRIVDESSGMSFYPDLIYSHPFREVTVVTAAKPVHSSALPSADCGLVHDMEAAGVMVAANKFLLSHNISILKIVSDPLEPQALVRKDIEHMVAVACSSIVEWIADRFEAQSARSICCGTVDLTNLDVEICNRVAERLRLTVTMRRRLVNSAKLGKVRGIDLQNTLAPFVEASCAHKSERQTLFARVLASLGEVIEKLD